MDHRSPTSDPSGTRTGIRLDQTAIKTLAHPLRSRLLSALRMNGPATATELADRLQTNTGATSYHLRQLEEVGLVADTGEGAGKRRVWKAATDSHQWVASDFSGDEDAEAAQNWLVRDYARQNVDRFERWLDVEQSWPDAWRDATGYSDSGVLATPEQLTELRDELHALMERYRDVGGDDPRARRVMLTMLIHPSHLDDRPEDDPS